MRLRNPNRWRGSFDDNHRPVKFINAISGGAAHDEYRYPDEYLYSCSCGKTHTVYYSEHRRVENSNSTFFGQEGEIVEFDDPSDWVNCVAVRAQDGSEAWFGPNELERVRKPQCRCACRGDC